MLKLRMVCTFPLGVMILLGAGAVPGQNYPVKPIRIATADAGGGADFLTRLVAQEITGPWASR